MAPPTEPADSAIMAPSWLGSVERPLAAWWHLPSGSLASAAVLVCPPIGLEALSAHRTIRRLCESLARRGIAAVRFDYAGTGDSADLSADIASSLETGSSGTSWVDSATDALRAMINATPGLPWGVVGLRMGALIAAAAVAGLGEPADGVVFWDPSNSAREFFREQRAFARLLGATGPSRDGVEGPGFYYSAQVVTGTRGLSLSYLDDPIAKRLLVLHRRARPVPEVGSSPASEISFEPVDGQEELLDVATWLARVPDRSIERISSWVASWSIPERRAIAPELRREARLTTEAGRIVVERHITVGPRALSGIETTPEAGARNTVVLLNNSTEHRVGHMSMWPALARHWATLGVRTVRLDVSGLGDSPTLLGRTEDIVYAPDAAEEIAEAVRSAGWDADDLHLVGYCSGGHTGLYAASLLGRTSAVAVNLATTARVPPMTLERSLAMNETVLRHRQLLERVGLFRLAQRVRAWLHRTLVLAPPVLWAPLRVLRPSKLPTAGLRGFRGKHALLLCGDDDAFGYRTIGGWEMRRLLRRAQIDFRSLEGVPHVLLEQRHRTTVADALTDYVREHATGAA